MELARGSPEASLEEGGEVVGEPQEAVWGAMWEDRVGDGVFFQGLR